MSARELGRREEVRMSKCSKKLLNEHKGTKKNDDRLNTDKRILSLYHYKKQISQFFSVLVQFIQQ